MMVAINNGNPLPPEHTQTIPCVSSTPGNKNESKQPIASFFLSLQPPGTRSYMPTHAAKPNGCNDSNHGPPMMLPQMLPHLSAAPGRKQHDNFAPPSPYPNHDTTFINKAIIYDDQYCIN